MKGHLMFKATLFAASAAALLSFTANAEPANRFEETRFVANKESYKAATVEPTMINAWGIAIRPVGAGGHFWVTAGDTSFEYVGDVHDAADETLRKLHTDSLKYVKLPVGGKENVATGVAFSDSKKDFVITQEVDGAEPITAPSKFLFASDGGVISAWTERKKEDGTFDRSGVANKVIDHSKKGAQYFGLAISKNYDRLYAANFGANPDIQVFDGKFKQVDMKFDMPFDDNKNGKVDPGEYAPFNIQGFGDHLFVAYAKTQPCPAEEVKAGSCKEGELFVGEEDTSKPGQGRVAEFTEEGKLVAVWKDGGQLSAPWGFAFAPADFGPLSNALLVGNFGSGTIAAYDADSREFIDVLRDKNGKPVVIDKLWGILFGNGESLGDSHALYFAAGPEDETDGLFGSLRMVNAK